MAGIVRGTADQWNDRREGVAVSDRKAFTDAMRDQPTDRTARLVFADWLQEHDRPEDADVLRDDDLTADQAVKLIPWLLADDAPRVMVERVRALYVPCRLERLDGIHGSQHGITEGEGFVAPQLSPFIVWVTDSRQRLDVFRVRIAGGDYPCEVALISEGRPVFRYLASEGTTDADFKNPIPLLRSCEVQVCSKGTVAAKVTVSWVLRA